MKIFASVVVCFGLGLFTLSLSFSKLMYSADNFTDGLYLAVLALIAGLAVSGYCANLLPNIWYVWPLLVGGPALLFTLYNWFIIEDTKGFLIWKIISIAFFVIPTIAAYVGRSMSK